MVYNFYNFKYFKVQYYDSIGELNFNTGEANFDNFEDAKEHFDNHFKYNESDTKEELYTKHLSGRSESSHIWVTLEKELYNNKTFLRKKKIKNLLDGNL